MKINLEARWIGVWPPLGSSPELWKARMAGPESSFRRPCYIFPRAILLVLKNSTAVLMNRRVAFHIPWLGLELRGRRILRENHER